MAFHLRDAFPRVGSSEFECPDGVELTNPNPDGTNKPDTVKVSPGWRFKSGGPGLGRKGWLTYEWIARYYDAGDDSARDIQARLQRENPRSVILVNAKP